MRVGGGEGPKAVTAPTALTALTAVTAAKAAGAAGPEDRGDEALRRLAGEDVTFLLAANPGEPPLPLAKVASGGELARAMLAVRLVLLAGGQQRSDQVAGPGTLVFDEVDAGVGGEAALAVGRALAELGRQYQVVVVTHLAQVAAFADAQVAVSKVEHDGRAVARAELVTGHERVVELSRMLSGQPDSATARRHAEELLQMVAARPIAAPGLAVAAPRAGGPRGRRRH